MSIQGPTIMATPTKRHSVERNTVLPQTETHLANFDRLDPREIKISIVHLQMSHSGNITMHVNLNVNGGRPPSQSSLHHSMDAADISMVPGIPELSVK